MEYMYIRHRAVSTAGVWSLVFLLLFGSLPFSGSPSGKPEFSFRKPLPTGDPKISKCLKCAPVQAETLFRCAKVVEICAITDNARPPRVPHPLGTPFWTPRSALNTRDPQSAPRILGDQLGAWCPKCSKMAPKWSQHGAQTDQKAVPECTQSSKCAM